MYILRNLYLFLLLGLITCNACAQSAHQNRIKDELAHEKKALSTAIVLNNEQTIIPLQHLEDLKIASINLGFNHAAAFNKMLANYAPVDTFKTTTTISSLQVLSEQLKFHNLLVVQVANQVLTNKSVLDFINHESANKQVILCGFGNIGQLALLDTFRIPIVWNSDTSSIGANCSASGIFGGIALSGRLTENVSPHYPLGSGYTTIKTRLGYRFPEAIGIKSSKLIEPIGQIVREAIAAKATLGPL